jgi:gliding motility-associated-like protein
MPLHLVGTIHHGIEEMTGRYVHLLIAMAGITGMPRSMVAQNLVPNPGLEESIPFCGIFNPVTFNTNVADWNTPTAGSPDIFHTSLPTTCPNAAVGSIASNSWGSEQPAGGEAMAALITYCQGCATETREYMQAQLLQPLEPGQVYRASMQVSRGDNCRYATDGLGMYFSVAPPQSSTWPALPQTPQVVATEVITLEEGWLEITGEFTATAAYQFITVGNFSNDANTAVQTMGAQSLLYAVYFVDELSLTLSSDNLTITGPASICEGDSAVLVALNTSGPVSWTANGPFGPVLGTNDQLLVAPTGSTQYWAISGGDTATFLLNVVPRPVIELGNDTTICEGELLLLDATTPGATYLWSDGSTSALLAVAEGGMVSVQVTVDGCSTTDSLLISLQLIPPVQLGNDTTLCPGDELLLAVDVPGATLLWQDGSSATDLMVTEAGVYWVQASIAPCSASDTIAVAYEGTAGTADLADTQLCLGEEFVVDLSANPGGVLWDDGSTEPVRSFLDQGIFGVQVFGEQCIHVFSFELTFVECDPAVEMPNVFSPNGDGRNDLFVPVVMRGLVAPELVIYNRWGMELYRTTNLVVGWNGRGAPDGVYYWELRYRDDQGAARALHGHVTLLR